MKEAYEWYERKKPGLGDELLDELDHTITKIERNPFHASGYDDQTRSATLERFPYEAIYLVDENKHEVYMIAISHQHRKPRWFLRKQVLVYQQPIFYPVMNEAQATQISVEWNVPAYEVAYVTKFEVDAGYLQKFKVEKRRRRNTQRTMGTFRRTRRV